MRALCSPRSASELAVIGSLLRAEGIAFFIHNEHFGAMEVGPSIPLLNERTVFVAEQDYERAAEVIARPSGSEAEAPVGRQVSFLGKLRMLLEVLAFVWVMPGSRRRRHAGEE
jgi:hypothetical protein